MRSERGQATVEWIGMLLLIALALSALARLAAHADGHGLGTSLAHSITHPRTRATPALPAATPAQLSAASTQPVATPVQPVATPAQPGAGVPEPSPAKAFVAPPLVPRPAPIAPWPGGSGAPTVRLPDTPALLQRVRRGTGAAWRRAWYACLIYERFRWAFLHPESRFPGYTMPPSEVLRIMNDCISPVDLVRDWPMLRDGGR
jgi:hypothetical protein